MLVWLNICRSPEKVAVKTTSKCPKQPKFLSLINYVFEYCLLSHALLITTLTSNLYLSIFDQKSTLKLDSSIHDFQQCLLLCIQLVSANCIEMSNKLNVTWKSCTDTFPISCRSCKGRSQNWNSLNWLWIWPLTWPPFMRCWGCSMLINVAREQARSRNT